MRTTISSHGYSLRAPMMLGLILATLAVAMGVSPAMAGGAAYDYGITVKCNYRTNSPGPAYTARLKSIVVTPPEMFAKSGQQTVGWRFAVRRTIDEGDYPSHKVTYQSPIQKAKATTTNAADFQTMSVDVTLPTTVEDQRDVFYQVAVTMLRYRPDGSVKSRTTYLVPQYKLHVRGDGWKYTEAGYDNCGAVQWAAV
jgi:hypothetical protein